MIAGAPKGHQPMHKVTLRIGATPRGMRWPPHYGTTIGAVTVDDSLKKSLPKKSDTPNRCQTEDSRHAPAAPASNPPGHPRAGRSGRNSEKGSPGARPRFCFRPPKHETFKLAPGEVDDVLKHHLTVCPWVGSYCVQRAVIHNTVPYGKIIRTMK